MGTRFPISTVPRWHFGMLNDRGRNEQYRDAIAAKLQGLEVLDIGIGTGLLSMYAARLGAKHVYGCELNPTMAGVAREIIRANGEADRISVIGRSSQDLRLGQDIPARAQGLVTEIMDCGMVGEGLLTSLAHARAHLLEANARIIPECIGIEFCLIQSVEVFNNNHVASVDGIDLSTFNCYATQGYFPVRMNTWPIEYLSTRQSALLFDLERGDIVAREETHGVTVTQDGIVHGLAFWFRALLAPGIVLTNSPAAHTHWAQAMYCLDPPRAVCRGERIEVSARTDLSNIEFEISARS
ncbi:50S ribosomal protein L11 methyltransferase [Bordetella sp. LUAb4]|uniref:50S ribosomal protein L11 methyltransferase n=1 Tax=Bordetella sp. LUAb4 TaxID=2843195 RepID=UPI001E4587E2|nr:50S ribosomal protein L11 methyltransferase [Bordetella sp. LUAb4]